jgi:peptidoglycan/LPS O-acetylase OafA/YrhL
MNQIDDSRDNFLYNNFDLIRLFAACQVAFRHSYGWLHLPKNEWIRTALDIIEMFPGVPIFFFISGFLISRSFERNSNIKQYFRNRFLRLFPGLIVCGFVSVCIVFSSGYLGTVNTTISSVVFWIIAQISFFQFYDAPFLSKYGSGNTNGVLWTIYIEIQFYISIPILYYLANKTKFKNRKFDILIIFIAFFFMLLQTFIESFRYSSLVGRTLDFTFIPFFYMFLVGVIFQRNYKFFYRFLSNKFIYLMIFYLAIYFILDHYFKIREGNRIEPILFIILSCLIFSAAYSFRELSHKLLNSFDISYGIYIYHMVIVNLFMYFGLTKQFGYYLLCIVIILIMAILSFKFIERPCMKYKKNPLHAFR